MKNVPNVIVYSPTNKAKNDYVAVALVNGRKLPTYFSGSTSDEARSNALAAIEGRQFKFFNEQSEDHDFVPDVLNFLNEPVTVKASIEKIDRRNGEHIKGKVWYHNPSTGERTRVTESEVPTLVEKGFIPGIKSAGKSDNDRRTGESLKGKSWFYHPETLERVRVSETEVQDYLDKGFVHGIKPKAEKTVSDNNGRTGEHIKGKVWVHKGSDRKRVTEAEAEEFIAFGYEYGLGKGSRKPTETVSEVSDTEVAPIENAAPEASNEATAEIVEDAESVSD